MVTMSVPLLFLSMTFQGGRGYKAAPLLMLMFPGEAKPLLEALLYREDRETPIHMEPSKMHVHVFDSPPYLDAGNFVTILDGSKQRKPFCIVAETDLRPDRITEIKRDLDELQIVIACNKGPGLAMTGDVVDLADYDVVVDFVWKGKIEANNPHGMQQVLLSTVGA